MMKMVMWIPCLSFYKSCRTTRRVWEPGPIISDYVIARGTTDLIKHITWYNPDDQMISVHLSRITEENTLRFDETRRLLYQSRDDTSGKVDRTSNWSTSASITSPNAENRWFLCAEDPLPIESGLRRRTWANIRSSQKLWNVVDETQLHRHLVDIWSTFQWISSFKYYVIS